MGVLLSSHNFRELASDLGILTLPRLLALSEGSKQVSCS